MSVMEKIDGDWRKHTTPVPVMAKMLPAEAVLRKVAPARRRVLAANCILLVGREMN
jgi:hypothetical protein